MKPAGAVELPVRPGLTQTAWPVRYMLLCVGVGCIYFLFGVLIDRDMPLFPVRRFPQHFRRRKRTKHAILDAPKTMSTELRLLVNSISDPVSRKVLDTDQSIVVKLTFLSGIRFRDAVLFSALWSLRSWKSWPLCSVRLVLFDFAAVGSLISELKWLGPDIISEGGPISASC